MQVPPPMSMEEFQAKQDADHLNLLAIFFKIMAVLKALLGFCPGIYALMGGAFLFIPASSSSSSSSDAPPAVVGGVFIAFGLLGMAIIWTIGILDWMASKRIEQRTGHTFITVVSALNCLNMPFGTALGIFSIVVTQRPSVKRLFGLIV